MMDSVAQGRAVRARPVRLAERMAAVEDRVAATLIRLAMVHPARAAYLLARSEAARERAARLRHRYPGREGGLARVRGG